MEKHEISTKKYRVDQMKSRSIFQKHILECLDTSTKEKLQNCTLKYRVNQTKYKSYKNSNDRPNGTRWILENLRHILEVLDIGPIEKYEIIVYRKFIGYRSSKKQNRPTPLKCCFENELKRCSLDGLDISPIENYENGIV